MQSIGEELKRFQDGLNFIEQERSIVEPHLSQILK